MIRSYNVFQTRGKVVRKPLTLLVLIGGFSLISCFGAKNERAEAMDKWSKKVLLFADTGSEDWKEKWLLDGTRATISNTPAGMFYAAGPEHGNDTCHAVLWTKKSFEGNIVIEYDYTRVDTTTRCVNILYFLATGKGNEEFPQDIAAWKEKRVVPSMRVYFNNMNTYHISYAAFSANKYSNDKDYVRLRRYDPSKAGLRGTDILPDYFETGLFKPFHTYRIQVARFNDQISMQVQDVSNPEKRLSCNWDVSDVPVCKKGRIGLRHMYTRMAIYKDFKVWSIE